MSDKDDKNGGEEEEFGSGGDEFGGFELDFGKSDEEEPGNEPDASEDPPTASGVPQKEAPVEETPSGDEEGGDEDAGNQEESGTDTTPKKRARKPLTKRQKVIRVMLRRAGIEELPELSTLMRDKAGVSMPVKSIALFIGEPEDEVLAELAEKLPLKNIVNLSAEVGKNRVVSVGTDILRAGRMFQPIQVAAIRQPDEGDASVEDDLQCTSGRHRLAFIVLAYGTEVSIPVYIESMTLNEARDAVVVANQARPTRALERAEHAVLGAVGGNADAQQKALYEATATTKARARKYCVYSVFEKGHPIKFQFPVSSTSSRKGGSLTTVSNVENFWSAALAWEKETPWKKFDGALKSSIQFLNELVKAMQEEEKFDSSHHLASMTLSAIGKWYKGYRELIGKDAAPQAPKVAKIIVALGEIGRQKSEATYEALTVEMRS